MREAFIGRLGPAIKPSTATARLLLADRSAPNRFRTLRAAETFYFAAAKQFWQLVVQGHTYVTGGNSEDEHFHEPGLLDARRDNINNDTCNSYDMLKLTRQLFMATGDVKYADFYERGYINEIMSAINPVTGMTTHFKPMGTGYFELFDQESDTFWCCDGTGMENYTKLNDSLSFHNADALFVNLYLSSTLNWQARRGRAFERNPEHHGQP